MSKLKYYDYLVHYNHNHDPRNGRFARSPGGSSGAEPRKAIRRERTERAFKPGSKGKPSPAEKIGRESINTVNTSKRMIGRQKRQTQKDYSNLSNAELQTRINRLQMERRYAELSAPQLSLGKQRALDILDATGDVMALGVSAAVIGAQIYKIKRG